MCVTLVGTMLSVGSSYQNLLVAKKWEDDLMNRTTTYQISENTSKSPLLSILKIPKKSAAEKVF
jgi:hypothetical protein